MGSKNYQAFFPYKFHLRLSEVGGKSVLLTQERRELRIIMRFSLTRLILSWLKWEWKCLAYPREEGSKNNQAFFPYEFNLKLLSAVGRALPTQEARCSVGGARQAGCGERR